MILKNLYRDMYNFKIFELIMIYTIKNKSKPLNLKKRFNSF